jgi:hypothetical protein
MAPESVARRGKGVEGTSDLGAAPAVLDCSCSHLSPPARPPLFARPPRARQAVANRASRPWIVVTGHRPIYSDKHVDSNGNPTGDSQRLQAAIEDLLMKYGVDLYISGERVCKVGVVGWWGGGQHVVLQSGAHAQAFPRGDECAHMHT